MAPVKVTTKPERPKKVHRNRTQQDRMGAEKNTMPEKNPQALAFLQTRRSRPAKTLSTPVPTRAELEPLLTTGARCPDHGTDRTRFCACYDRGVGRPLGVWLAP